MTGRGLIACFVPEIIIGLQYTHRAENTVKLANGICIFIYRLMVITRLQLGYMGSDTMEEMGGPHNCI